MIAFVRKNYPFMIIFFIVACSSKARNILMTPRIEEKGIVKLYYDREGDLYPPEVHITPYYFYLEDIYGTKKKRTKQSEFASLRAALTKHDSVTIEQLKEKYNLDELDYDPRDYDQLQAILIKNYLKQIEAGLKDNSTRSMVLLIHGFNDPNPDASYYLLRRKIYEYNAKKPVIVEVYWDGLSALGDNPVLSNIWDKARPNSAKIGLGLRKLISKISPDVKITVITHSLGASVATQLLFNPAKWKDDFRDTLQIKYFSDSIPTPQQKTVLAMLAPAIPGRATFKGINRIVPSTATQNLTKIVFGYNKYDFAVSKGGVVPADWFGSTTLGSDYHYEVSKTIDLLQDSAKSIKCYPINFSYKSNSADTLSKKERKALRQKEHDILKYVTNEHFDAFMKAVFSN